MPLSYTGRSFVLPLGEAPPYSVERLGHLGLISRVNNKYNLVHLRDTPYFYSHGLEFVEDILCDERAQDRIDELKCLVNDRKRKVSLSLRAKKRVPSEEEYLPSYHGFKDSPIRLFRSQIIGIDLCAYMRRYALFFEQRCGKTLCMLGAYNRICRNDKRDYRMLVFTGKSIMHVWEEHINEFMKNTIHIRIYEKFKDAPYMVDQLKGKVIAVTTHSFTSPKKLNLIKRYNPDIIVLDESQAFKSTSTARYKNIMGISKPKTMRFCLSGTPTGQGYIDLYAQLKWMYEYDFPPSKTAFMNKYCHVYEKNNVKIISGYKNVGEIRKAVRINSYRVKQEENFKVPDKEDVILYVPLDDKTLSDYHMFRRTRNIELDNKVLKIKNPLVLMNKLRQFLGGQIISNYEDVTVLHEVSHEKLSVLRDYIVANKPTRDDKLIIYCVFLHEIDMIRDMISGMEIAHEVISGKVSIKNRERIINAFQNNDDPSVIIGQIKTLSAGVKLSASKRILFYSPDFSYQVIEQAKERIVDATQKHDVKYIYLVVKNTIDEQIIRLLNKIKTQTDYILDS